MELDNKLALDVVAVAYCKAIESLRLFAELQSFADLSGPEALMKAADTLEVAIESMRPR